MTIYNVLMMLGVIVLVGIVVKGFWGARRIKAIEQPDNWQTRNPPTDPHHGD
jgi:FtsZ-interacting cell division protein ZipA